MANPLLENEAADLEAMLAPYLRSGKPRYRAAPWLKCSFESEVWTIECGRRFDVDWRLRLPDGRLLTSKRHAPFLESLRSWLIARTHIDLTGRSAYEPRTTQRILRSTLHCFDYLILRSAELGILNHGLDAVSSNDVRAMLASMGSNRSVSTAVYQWPDRLTQFLRNHTKAITDDLLRQARRLIDDLEHAIPDPADRLTSLDDTEIIAARAWLALHGHYKRGHISYRLSPRASYLAAGVYSGTLIGRMLPLPLATELCVGPDHRVFTEFPRARVASPRDRRVCSRILGTYVDTLAAWALVDVDRKVPPRISVDELKRFVRTIDAKPDGRFRTLPQAVVLGSLRKALEYALAYGDALVDSYLVIAARARGAGQSIAAFADGDIGRYLTDGCKQLGVRRWTIEPPNTGAQGAPDPLPKTAWYRSLRANEGLYECLRVLYGAIQLVIGATTARRIGELLDLKAGASLDATATRLVFRNRKSGFAGLREQEARPIPPVCARFIHLLERLQRGLVSIGAIDEITHLFASPRTFGRVGLAKAGLARYGEALDLFCDWSETALDSEGRRYYIRQHQLRRFFAMLFFWGGGFGGMDTLRWFLGHTDVAHLWHYITETTPGATIRSVAAEWAAYSVKHATQAAELLANELREHFGTSDFSVLDEEALTLHLEDLIDEGRLIIEPQFLDRGRSYRIAVVLREKEVS